MLQQRLSQLDGVGQVEIGGSSLPAVRVELNPLQLYKYGIGLEDVRAALSSANANSPKGAIESDTSRIQIYTNDQASKAADYKGLVLAYRNSNPVYLSDVAQVVDSVQDIRNRGLAGDKRSILVIIFRQPGANIIDTINNIKHELVHLKAAMPASINIIPAIDRSTTISASLHDTERRWSSPSPWSSRSSRCSCSIGAQPSCRASPCRSRSSAPSASCTCSASASTSSRSWR